MSILTYTYGNYALELDRGKGIVWKNGLLLFKGFGYTAIKIYVENVPEHRHKFRSQLSMRQKVVFNKSPVPEPEIEKPQKKLKKR